MSNGRTLDFQWTSMAKFILYADDANIIVSGFTIEEV